MMDQMTLTEREKNQGKKMFDLLYKTSPTFIRMDIDNMDVEEAKRVWRILKPYQPLVASRGSSRKRDMKHLTVLRMMQWIQDKANGGE